jgi:hypothetical protein
MAYFKHKIWGVVEVYFLNIIFYFYNKKEFDPGSG